MDRNAFDGLTRLLASSPNRRAALGVLLGAGLADLLGTADAAKRDRKKKRRNGKKGKGKDAAQVAAQAADCLSPGPSSNMNGCPFQGSDFSGQDLSGSSMVGTNFNVSALVGTDLSSSNMKNATFRGANLTCADLSSSTLRGADFRGFPATGPNVGPPTDLTKADLSSSGGCGTILTNNRTILCGTIWCDGSVRNDSCPGGPPAGVCCGETLCGVGQTCDDGTCVCPDGTVELPTGDCAVPCEDPGELCPSGGPNCLCSTTGSAFVCAGSFTGPCLAEDCPPGSACFGVTCQALCGLPTG